MEGKIRKWKTINSIHTIRVRGLYESVSKSFRTGRLERELQMEQLSAIRCSCIAILWVSLVIFATTALCVASQRVFISVSVNFAIDSVRKLLDYPLRLTCHRTNLHVNIHLITFRYGRYLIFLPLPLKDANLGHKHTHNQGLNWS
jgi:hypothetical protein